MRALDGQNHYEILEVSRRARPEEIERAYRIASATWAEGSLALYSLFEDADAVVVRDRVLSAYRVLSDERARRVYDQATFGSQPRAPLAPSPPGRVAELGSDGVDYDDLDISLERALDGTGEASEDFDGPRLRRARMHRGVEIDDIAQVTKVTSLYLQAIEDEAFETLPPAVYVRGFVSAYARAIGLDPKRVADSYILRLETAHREKGRGRILGRR
jgi:hypothetical protein